MYAHHSQNLHHNRSLSLSLARQNMTEVGEEVWKGLGVRRKFCRFPDARPPLLPLSEKVTLFETAYPPPRSSPTQFKFQKRRLELCSPSSGWSWWQAPLAKLVCSLLQKVLHSWSLFLLDLMKVRTKWRVIFVPLVGSSELLMELKFQFEFMEKLTCVVT